MAPIEASSECSQGSSGTGAKGRHSTGGAKGRNSIGGKGAGSSARAGVKGGKRKVEESNDGEQVIKRARSAGRAAASTPPLEQEASAKASAKAPLGKPGTAKPAAKARPLQRVAAKTGATAATPAGPRLGAARPAAAKAGPKPAATPVAAKQGSARHGAVQATGNALLVAAKKPAENPYAKPRGAGVAGGSRRSSSGGGCSKQAVASDGGIGGGGGGGGFCDSTAGTGIPTVHLSIAHPRSAAITLRPPTGTDPSAAPLPGEYSSADGVGGVGGGGGGYSLGAPRSLQQTSSLPAHDSGTLQN